MFANTATVQKMKEYKISNLECHLVSQLRQRRVLVRQRAPSALPLRYTLHEVLFPLGCQSLRAAYGREATPAEDATRAEEGCSWRRAQTVQVRSLVGLHRG